MSFTAIKYFLFLPCSKKQNKKQKQKKQTNKNKQFDLIKVMKN
jgi:hypothetical protein